MNCEARIEIRAYQVLYLFEFFDALCGHGLQIQAIKDQV
jgi:hypothetical protein